MADRSLTADLMLGSSHGQDAIGCPILCGCAGTEGTSLTNEIHDVDVPLDPPL